MSRDKRKGQRTLEDEFRELAAEIKRIEHDKKWFEPDPFVYYIQEWNIECRYYCERNEEPYCSYGQDTTFCNANCCFATNNTLRSRTTKK